VGSLQVREFAREREQSVEMFLDRDVPPQKAAWFEHAVACAAFLSWRLSSRAASIRFRSQDFDMRLPEECDIYTILKFLAMVQPLEGKPVEGPLDDALFHIVLTPSPERFREAGWNGAHFL